MSVAMLTSVTLARKNMHDEKKHQTYVQVSEYVYLQKIQLLLLSLYLIYTNLILQ